MSARQPNTREEEIIFCPACGRQTLKNADDELIASRMDEIVGCTTCHATVFPSEEELKKAEDIDLGCCTSDKDCWCSR